MIPQTRYTKTSDGTYLAYQEFGEGDQDLLWVPGFATHLEVFWEYPPAARFLRRLATFSRVIWFDKRDRPRPGLSATRHPMTLDEVRSSWGRPEQPSFSAKPESGGT